MPVPLFTTFYLQFCPLHFCQVVRIEKCPPTKFAACGLRNPYPVSVWCNSVTPCTIYVCPSLQKLANGTTYRTEIYTKHSMDDSQFNCPIFNFPFSLVQKIWTLE